MFDAIAARYDVLNHLLSAGIDRYWRQRAIDSLALRGTERLLDVCTGTADLAIAARLARPWPARHVVGLDFAAAMLEVARLKIGRRRLANAVSLVRSDAARLPLADRSVDAVTVGFGIRNVERPEAACDEMHRVLVPGGRLAILEFAVPTWRLVRAPYLWYFNHILPRIGRVVSRHSGAYGYLSASVNAFILPGEFAAMLRSSGFTDVAAHSLTFGIVFLYTGRRPPSDG